MQTCLALATFPKVVSELTFEFQFLFKRVFLCNKSIDRLAQVFLVPLIFVDASLQCLRFFLKAIDKSR